VSPENEVNALTQQALDSINAAPVEAAQDEPDAQTNRESFEREKQNAELDSFKQDTGERKKHARNIFILTCAWVTAVFALLMLQGFGGLYVWHFHLTDSIVLTAIGSTTANIVGVFLIVARYFFPKKKL
jgi:hypothetical protein